MLWDSLAVELLKLKRTFALWMTLIAPALVVALEFLVVIKQGDRMTKSADVWPVFNGNISSIWAVLMLPLFVTLEAALLAQLEHANRHWKELLVLPAPRSIFYLSKFLVLAAMVALSTAVIYVLSMGTGNLLRAIAPRVHFGPTPWTAVAIVYLKLVSSTLAMLAIQHWFSLRWKSFTVAVSTGMSAVVVGFVVVNSEYGDFYPWSMPAHAFGGVPGRFNVVLITSLLVGGLALAAGAWDFVRQEFG
jgi:hypothetical protein